MDSPPGYSEYPQSSQGPTPSAPYGQSTLLHEDDGKKPQPAAPPPQSAWDDPNVNQQYPPPGYPQYPPAAGPYGQPMAAGYPPPPGYAAGPYYAPPQPQQQQQVVVVNGGQQPVIYRQPETFIGQMILACFVLWCCNCPFGLAAFILAGQPKQNSFPHSFSQTTTIYVI